MCVAGLIPLDFSRSRQGTLMACCLYQTGMHLSVSTQQNQDQEKKMVCMIVFLTGVKHLIPLN